MLFATLVGRFSIRDRRSRWIQVLIGAAVFVSALATWGTWLNSARANPVVQDANPGAVAVPSGIDNAKTSAPDRSLQDKLSQELLDLSFDDLKFEIPVGKEFDPSLLTESIEQLDGRKIKIRGYIKPNFQQRAFSKFILVRDNQECCFGPGAAIYDCILIMLDEGLTTDFTVRPVTIVGTMYIKEYKGPDGRIWAIFRMKQARVE